MGVVGGVIGRGSKVCHVVTDISTNSSSLRVVVGSLSHVLSLTTLAGVPKTRFSGPPPRTLRRKDHSRDHYDCDDRVPV